MTYVIDSSFGAAHSLPDEQNDDIDSFFDNLTDQDILSVPQLFWYEISNIFKKTVMRNRIESEDVPLMLEDIGNLNLVTDAISGSNYSTTLFTLAREYNLTCYDAAYLELAIRTEAVVGTLDNELKEACIKAGLQTV
jgi:predicted nucleic acid-binding protein